MSSLSICVLARDEQDFLPECLASVQGADEIVVLDTGSVDRTCSLAREAGAMVVHLAWPGDFGVVRQAAAEAATGEWVFFLDADERLGCGGLAALRRAVDEGVLVGLVSIFDADSMGATIEEVLDGIKVVDGPALQPRLLRRDLAQSWSHGACEVPDVDLTLAVEIDAPIAHYGACHHARNARRNSPEVWLRRAAAWPFDAAVQAEAARRLRAAGRCPEALLRAREAWRLATGVGSSRRGLVQAAMVHALLLLDSHKPLDARHVLEHARRLGAGHPNLDLLLGLCAIELDDERSLAQGELALRRAVEQAGRTYMVKCLSGATGSAARIALATVHLAQGKIDAAAKACGGLDGLYSRGLPARLLDAELELRQGREDGAMRRLVRLLEYAGADGWILAASAAAELGDRDDAVAFCDRADEAVEGGLIAPHRRRLLAAVRARLAAGAVLGKLQGDVAPRTEISDPVAVGEAAAVAGQLERAHALFIEALRRDVGDVVAWRDLGVVFQRAGVYDAAMLALGVVRDLEPEDTAAALDLARCLWLAHRWTDAAAVLRSVVDLEPEAARLLQQLGVQGARRPAVGLVGTDVVPGLADAIRQLGLHPVRAFADVVALESPLLNPEDAQGIARWLRRIDPGVVVVHASAAAAGTWCRVAREHGCTVVWTGIRVPEQPVNHIVNDDVIAQVSALLTDVPAPLGEIQPPMLSVIVPTQNREAKLLALLDRLALQDVGPGVFEVIVVDDGSDVPVDAALLQGRPYTLRVLRQASAGPAAARNAGIDVASARWVLFLDDDAVPATDLVRRHLVLQGHASEPVAIMGGFELLDRHRRTVWDHVLATTTLHLGRPDMSEGELVGWRSFCIANTSLPLWALRAVGGFDPDFSVPVYEDAELALRLKRRVALPTLYHPEIRCGHDHRVGVHEWMQRAMHAGSAQYRLREKHSDDVGILRLGREGEAQRPLLDALRSVLEFGEGRIEEGKEALRRIASLRWASDPEVREQAVQGTLRLARMVGDALHQRGLVKAAMTAHAAPLDPAGVVSVVLWHDGTQSHSDARLRCALASLRRNTRGPVELIVVCRGCVPAWLAGQRDVVSVCLDAASERAEGWNRGIESAAGIAMMLCDDTMLFSPGWREVLIGHMNTWSDVGMVAPLGARTREGLDAAASSFAEDHAGEHAWPVTVAQTRWLVRREVIAQIGGLDPAMAGLAGDDFCLRAQALGWRLRQAGDCLVGAIESAARPGADAVQAFRSRWRLAEGSATREGLRRAVEVCAERAVPAPVCMATRQPLLLMAAEARVEVAQGNQQRSPETAVA